MEKIKMSKLIEQKNIAHSITISPGNNGFSIQYILKKKNKWGRSTTKTVIVSEIVEDIKIPEVGNSTVKHFGYNTYKHYVTNGFYINYYKLWENLILDFIIQRKRKT